MSTFEGMEDQSNFLKHNLAAEHVGLERGVGARVKTVLDFYTSQGGTCVPVHTNRFEC